MPEDTINIEMSPYLARLLERFRVQAEELRGEATGWRKVRARKTPEGMQTSIEELAGQTSAQWAIIKQTLTRVEQLGRGLSVLAEKTGVVPVKKEEEPAEEEKAPVSLVKKLLRIFEGLGTGRGRGIGVIGRGGVVGATTGTVFALPMLLEKSLLRGATVLQYALEAGSGMMWYRIQRAFGVVGLRTLVTPSRRMGEVTQPLEVLMNRFAGLTRYMDVGRREELETERKALRDMVENTRRFTGGIKAASPWAAWRGGGAGIFLRRGTMEVPGFGGVERRERIRRGEPEAAGVAERIRGETTRTGEGMQVPLGVPEIEKGETSEESMKKIAEYLLQKKGERIPALEHPEKLLEKLEDETHKALLRIEERALGGPIWPR